MLSLNSKLEKLSKIGNHSWKSRGLPGRAGMQIKRTFTFIENIDVEAGKQINPPLRKIAVAAIVDNPFAGRYEHDLSQLTKASAEIGRHICQLAVSLLSPYKVESYGKAAIIGTSGEQEHGVAMLTTIFGNVMREMAGGGKAWISSFTKRAAPGATIDIPLAHKDALYVRSHYDGITIMLPDAPRPDEIAIICAYANRGRPNHRVGGLAANEIKGIDGLI
jgi:Amino acid synthesis